MQPNAYLLTPAITQCHASRDTTAPIPHMSLEKELVDTAGLPRDDVDFAEPENHVDDPGPSPAVALKTSEILAACTWRDATRLRALAESEGGLLADTLRQAACMYL